MKKFIILSLFLAVALANAQDAGAAEVLKGEVTKHSFTNSAVFPGTVRDYWLYVPAQYDPSKPACVHVNQDGIQFNAPAVFDRLIATREMPVTVGIFVTPGVVKALSTNALDRFNRSYEYDSVNDNYARFLLDELLPHIVREHKLNLSTNANDRSIGGSSSGAICAFTAAWERPDAFRRVFSAIGTYVGLRGGDCYPTLIRKTEPKPLRVFLQDGSSDLNIYGGDWWMANQTMERALTFAGYEVNHVWGEGGHSNKQGTEVFADAMRWLWKDWPTPIKAGQTKNAMLNDILLPGENWQLIGTGYHSLHGCAANAKGEVFFNDMCGGGKTYKISFEGNVSLFRNIEAHPKGLAFGPDGRQYITTYNGDLVVFGTDDKATKIAENMRAENIVVRHDGTIYVTAPSGGRWPCSTVEIITPTGKTEGVLTDTDFASGIALSPDKSLLYVSDFYSPWVISYQIQPDGTLTHKQHYYWLHTPGDTYSCGASGMCVDRDGRLYVITNLGIQVCDQAGRVNVILPLPVPGYRCRNICLGGENFDTLFVTCYDKVFKRKLKTKGVLPFQPPIKPVAPKL